MRCGTELVPGQHEAIVEADTWDAVQAQLSNNRRKGGAETRNKGGAVLRELVFCGRCGSPMLHVFSTPRRGRRYRYYICAKAHNEGAGKCPKARMAAGPFEQFVVDQIKVMGTDATLVAKTAAAVEQVAAERETQIADERRLLRGRVGNQDDLDRRREELDAEANAIGTGAVDPDALRIALAGFQPIWNTLFPREQERILRLLIERITYHPDGGDVDLELRPCGINVLAAEAKETA
jgi:site-specific DNA recombinase